MKKGNFWMIEKFLISCMKDSTHNKEHIYHVLYNALEFAKAESNINYDVQIVSSLLHDIG